jgi:hypothetical protein
MAESPPGTPSRVFGDWPPGRFIIAAESAGSAFPTKPFAFTVHSIFRSALNLRIEADFHLISLVADSRNTHARGALIPGAHFDEWNLERGTQGFFDGYCLSFWAADSPRALIGPPRADAEELSPTIEPSAALDAALSRAAALVASARAERGSSPIFVGTELVSQGETFIMSLRSAGEELSSAFVSRSIPAALQAAERIVGLGTGLTPSGDDFLCGFLAARRSLASDGGALSPDIGETSFLDEWGRRFTEIWGGPLSRTNDISAAFLSSAAEGRFSTALVAFARAIAAEIDQVSVRDGLSKKHLNTTGSEALASAVSMIGSIGHGSGLDAAEGFLYGLQAGNKGQYGNEA